MDPSLSLRLIPKNIEPPCDIDYLSQWLGIEVEIRPLPNKVSGLYIKTQHCAHIVLNSKDSPDRQRWTHAHELAHHILNIGRKKSEAVFEVNHENSSKEEILCDRFAAEILMPASVLKRKAAELPESIEITSELAKLFEVNPAAMQIRLRELNIS